MKKYMLITALILLGTAFGSFANEDRGPVKASQENFSREFKSATEVRWQSQNNYIVASFNLDGQILTAYYDHEARLVAVLHHLSVDHLPILLMKELKKNYGGYWVTGLFEAVTDGDSHYYLTLENADEIMKLKSSGSTDWTVEKRLKKND